MAKSYSATKRAVDRQEPVIATFAVLPARGYRPVVRCIAEHHHPNVLFRMVKKSHCPWGHREGLGQIEARSLMRRRYAANPPRVKSRNSFPTERLGPRIWCFGLGTSLCADLEATRVVVCRGVGGLVRR